MSTKVLAVALANSPHTPHEIKHHHMRSAESELLSTASGGGDAGGEDGTNGRRYVGR